MYDAGYSSNKHEFFNNIGSILVFAILGTMLSAFAIGIILYLVCILIEQHLTLNDCLMFGASISAVDPVATLAVFKALNVDSTLHMLVFGESVVNDAVSIALFNTFSRYSRHGYDLDILPTLLLFLYEFVGPIGVGAILGVITALLFRVISFSRYPTLETAMFFLLMYIPFVLCESIGMSGILGALFQGMVAGHYTHYSLSEEGKITTH